MATLVQEVISKLGASSDETVRAAAVQAVLSLSVAGVASQISRQDSVFINNIQRLSIITLENGVKVPQTFGRLSIS